MIFCRSDPRVVAVARAVWSFSSEAERPVAAAVRPPLQLSMFSLQARPSEYRTPGHTDSASSAPSSVGGDFEDWEAIIFLLEYSTHRGAWLVPTGSLL